MMRTHYSLIKTIFSSSFSFRFHPTLIILFSLSLAIFYISPAAQADTIPAAQAANSIFTGTFYCKTIAFLDVGSAAACEVTNAPQRDCAYRENGTETSPADWHTDYYFLYNAGGAPCGNGSSGGVWVKGNATRCSLNSTAISASTCQCDSGYVVSGDRCIQDIQDVNPFKNTGPSPPCK